MTGHLRMPTRGPVSALGGGVRLAGYQRGTGRSMRRSTSRILTTHAGSLPRPAELDDAVEQHEPGEAGGDARLGAILQRSVADVVRQQAAAGVDVVNDG